MTDTVLGAIIGVGGAIIGAFIGAWGTYHFALSLTRDNIKVTASAKLHAAFAPEIAQMRLFANGQKIDVRQLLPSAFPRHTTAIEEFGFYVPKEQKEEYYQAWQKYHEVGFEAYYMGEKPYELFFERVRAILQFTE